MRRAMTRRLVEAVRNAGGRVLTGPDREVVAIGREGDRISSVTLRGGQTIPVATVVNAAGPDAAALRPWWGETCRWRRRPGWPCARRCRTELTRCAGRWKRTTSPCARMVPAASCWYSPRRRVELDGMRPGPVPLDDPLVAQMMAWGAAAVPALAAARPIAALVGVRPIPADGLPSVGAVPGIPGYVEAVTHSGVTLAPLIARSLADEILGEPGDPLLAPFRPDRFPRRG